MTSAPRTLAQPIVVAGVGIHTGAPSSVTLRPSTDPGLRFRVGGETIHARADRVADTRRCTLLREGESSVSTVEHLLSACAGLGVAALEIDVDGPELPIGDGSAAVWARAIGEAGLTGEASAPRPLPKPCVVAGENGAFVAAYPASRLSVTCAVHFQHPVVGLQLARFVGGEDYAVEIAPARTFGFREEVARLLAAGLAKGGSLENAVIVEPDGYSVPLRFDNELARHKLLDLLGDLYLAGALPCAEIVAVRPSHGLNTALARALAEVWET